MLRSFNLKTISVVIVFIATILSQLIFAPYASAASITSGQEFYTNRSNICMTSTCDALVQWGVHFCVVAAANGNNFYGSGFNGGAAAYQAAKANIGITNKTSDAYILLASLFAYYYGVNASSCGYTENTGLTNPNSIASLDNIGAAFDMLTILKGDNVSTNYFHYNGSYVTLFNVISPITDLVVSYDNNNQVCQQKNMTDTYNTAMDITSGSYDIGRAAADTTPRTMVGLVGPQWAGKCGSIPTNGFYNKLDIVCGNISSYPQGRIPQIACVGICVASCLMVATNYSPSLNQQTSVYINWHLPTANPTAIRVKDVVVQKIVNGNGPGENIAPQVLQGPVGVSLGPPGYMWNQGNSNSNPITIVDSPSMSASGGIVYSASLTYVTSSNGNGTNITCSPTSIVWGGSPSGSGSTSLACTAAGLAQEAAQKNVYNPAYNNWFNYDQGSYQGSTFWDGYQHYKTATDNAAVALQGPLSTYINAYNAYNNAVANVASIQAAYDAVVNSGPPAAFVPTALLPPTTTTYTITPVTTPGYWKYWTSGSLKNHNRHSGYIWVPPTTTYVVTPVTTSNAAANAIITASNTAGELAYQTNLANYKAAVIAARNAYNIAMPPARAQEAAARTAAITAWNDMQPYYKPWLNLSDNTYYQTMNYPLLAPWYPTYNSNSFYNQDLNLYNASVSALNVWKTAYQNQATICDSQPYFTVSGGDIIAGSGSANSNGFCSPNYSANIFASNVGGSSWIGASDNLSALAPSVINGLSTGSGGDALTFANTVNAPYGGNFGSANGVCNLDYYSTKNNLVGFSVSPASGGFDLSTATGNSACKLIDTTNYCSLNGPIKISGNPPAGSKVVVYINGNAEISESISIYNNGSGLNSAADIPLLYVISNSNIYIDSAATSIDGVYSANGTIFTCANAGTGNSFSGNQADQALIAGCNNQLTVNGSLVANQIKFGRVYGGLPGQYGSTGAAETFNYGPEVWLSQVQGSLPVNPDYQALTELSPVI